MNELKLLKDKCEELEERIDYLFSSIVTREVIIINSNKNAVEYDIELSHKAGALEIEMQSVGGDTVAASVKLGTADAIASNGAAHYMLVARSSSGDYKLKITLSKAAADSAGISVIIKIKAPQLALNGCKEVHNGNI